MSAAFVPCSHCRRHVRAGDVCRYCDTRAPFAPNVARGSRSAFLVATALVAASGGLGCKDDDKGDKVTMDEPRRPKDPTQASATESAKAPPAPTAPPAPPVPSPSTSASELALGTVDGGLGLMGIGVGAAYGGPPPGPGLGTIGIPAPAAYGIAPPSPTGITAPTGVASPAPATVTGGVSNADSVIARNRWRFKACYNKALASDPTIAGKVTVRATVNADGEVTKSELVSTTVPASLASCIVSAPNGMKFESTGGVSTVTFSVTLASKP